MRIECAKVIPNLAVNTLVDRFSRRRFKLTHQGAMRKGSVTDPGNPGRRPFGSLGGVIIVLLAWIIAWSCDVNALNLDLAMFVGYAAMVVSLTVVFFGIKSYRDNYAGGQITFLKGLQIGILISLIGCVFYFIGAVSYDLAHPGWVERITEKFTQHTVGKLVASGASRSELDAPVK